ncbi:MAG: AAA family ATPase [Acidobacteriota bacterium]|nr:AAA family ATPase [Acidobacteriota bacterium]
MKTPVCFPLRRAAELDADPQPERWLIESLWADQAVGIVGGEPKCCKSFLALDMAVSVASGAPCLRRYPPRQRGPVLLFAAEDPLHIVRERLEAVALAAEIDFEALDIHVITAPTLRLDLDEHRRRLQSTVEKIKPRLLVLDPFVRLHRVDENAVADVAPLLGYLRTLQRSFQTAVLLVHHARKGAGAARAGQALRGSSEMHAWGDSLLYLRRGRAEQLKLSGEHRANPSIEGITLELKADGDALALQPVEEQTEQPETQSPPLSPDQRVEQALAQTSIPLSIREVRKACRMRMSRVSEALETLTTKGRVRKEPGGFRLVNTAPAFLVSQSPIGPAGNGRRKHPALPLLPGETDSGSAGAQPEEG